MPLNILFFNSLLLATCGYAAWRGGLPERYVAASLFVAAMATLVTISPYSTRFVGVEYGVLVVDSALLVVLVAIALHANRYWPLALASLHLASLVAHFGKLLDYSMGGWGYAFLLKLWAYPMLLTLVIGTIRHRRRVSQFGVDRSWSTFNG
ncbi:hypothetical protein [Sphingomonas rubra]|uniref:Uncharacterized protein n=1 Tax=Sphingomonas rubra TaxID=634430 RepID=A0A1I5SJA6_9SPHN|nr:hypothetical protein [Sphingomonas rubra]SFP70446.1 hypothetical protein SAMN04488241_105249 [Sphingomonas rubra]